MSETKKTWIACLKSVVYSSLASLGVFMLFAWVIGAVFNEIGPEWLREMTLHVVMMVMYAVFFYLYRFKKRLVTYTEQTDQFALKPELLAYVRTEGKIMFILYGIAAAVTEISRWIIPGDARNPVLLVSHFFMGPWMALNVPVLRAVVAFVYSSALVCLLAVLRSRRIHQEKLWVKQDKIDRRE